VTGNSQYEIWKNGPAILKLFEKAYISPSSYLIAAHLPPTA